MLFGKETPTEVEPEQPKKRRGRPSVPLETAVKWLGEYLKDGSKPACNKNAQKSEGVFGDAVAAGFTSSTIWRAAEALGIQKERGSKDVGTGRYLREQKADRAGSQSATPACRHVCHV